MAGQEGIMTPDEIQSLISSGPKRESAPAQTSAPASPAPPSRGASREEIETLIKPKDAPTVGFGEDFARSAGAGLGKGALSLAGLPGDVRNLIESGLQYTGMGSLGERYVPTSEEVVNKAKELVPSLTKHLDYKPQFHANEYVKTAAEFAPSAVIPGGGLGLGARLAGAVGSGVATQAAEDYLSKTPLHGTGWETAAKIAAGIPGYMAGTKALSTAQNVAGGVLRPGAEAERRLAAKMGEDIVAGGKYGAKMTPAEAVEKGVDVAPAAMAGKRTDELIQNAAKRVSPEVAGAYEAAIEPMKQGAKPRMTQFIDDMFGGENVNAFDEIAAINSRARQVNSQGYSQVMGMPHAKSIQSPALQGIITKLPEGTLNDAFTALRESGIDPAAVGAIRTQGGYALNPNGMGLKFWDEVKQALDTRINKLKDPTTGKISDNSAWGRWNKTNEELRNVLDKAVPEYGSVRGSAAEAAGAASAMDLGTRYLTTSDPKRVNFIENTFKKLSPEQQYDFAYGVASSYKRAIETDPNAALALFSGKKGGEAIRKMNLAMSPLGGDAGYQMVGRANAELLNAHLSSIKPQAGLNLGRPGLLPIAGGLVGTALELGEMLLQPTLWSGNPSAFIPALVGFGGGKIYNWKEARIASKVLEYAADPSNNARLAKLLETTPEARSFLQKTNNILGRAVAPGLASDSQRQQQEQGAPAQGTRASGGRVGRAAGGRLAGIMTAERLMRAAHMAKQKINKTTERILDQPDESVVKALSIAQQNI